MAKLYFRYGAMNSGKSTSLLQAAHNYEERDHQILLAKPGIDLLRVFVLARVFLFQCTILRKQLCVLCSFIRAQR